MKLLAITGFARSGKNTLAKEIKEEIKNSFPDYKVEEFSFAYCLRQELYDFIFDNFGISAFTENDNEKKIVRSILIGYGNARRIESGGTYWVERLNKIIENSDANIGIITDLRFDEYEKDELSWLKDCGGINIHLKRYSGINGKRKYEKAPNEFEKENDPKLEKTAKSVFKIERKEKEVEFKKEIKLIAREFVENNFEFLL